MISNSILKKCEHEGFAEDEVYDAYKIFFGTLVSEPRLRIINLLRTKEKNVSEILKELNMDQTAVSHDLARLKQCGFVNLKKKGKFRYYDLNQETIKPLMDLIDRHMGSNCIHILHSQQRDLKGGESNDKK